MKVVCFDLDDTLYKEIDYLKAAYRLIAKHVWGEFWESWYERMMSWYYARKDVFGLICSHQPGILKEELINLYRYCEPDIFLSDDVCRTLETLYGSGVKLGLITDGRAVTQMNKINALGLNRFIGDDMMVISEKFGSEKLCEGNFRYFMEKFVECRDFTYVGDNIGKDFAVPNKLGWTTICLLDDGRNIHGQDFSLSKDYLPQSCINSLSDLVI